MAAPQVTTLATGERVISERLAGVRSVALGLWVGVGSRDETRARAGASHFIEHLLFRGTERHGAREIAELFDEMGAELNAATSRDTTVLYTRLPDRHLEPVLDVMLAMLYTPSFDDVDAERRVVLEEIAMVDDNPEDLVHDLAADAVFGGHPLGRPVIGSADVIASISTRALRGYHRSTYVGGNVVVAAAGNLRHERLVELVEARRQGVARTRALPRSLVRRQPAPSIRFLRRPTEQYHVVLSGPGIARDDPRRYAGWVLDTMLGGSSSSRLFQEIRERRGMAYSVYSFASQFEETGQVGIALGTREENLAECMRVVRQEVGDLAAGGLRAGELARAKESIEGRLLLAQESTASRMTRLGRALVTDTELVSLRETVRRIRAVRADEVVTLARELFAPERLSAAGIGPSEKRFRAALEHLAPAAEAA